VQAASILQGPPVAAPKSEMSVRSDAEGLAAQPSAASWVEKIATVVLGPLAVAVVSYVLVRKTT